MQKVRLETGYIIERLTDAERKQVWDIIETPSYDQNHPFFTPNDNLKYFVLSSKMEGCGKCTDVIKANGKVFTVVADVCKLDEKTLKAVRNAYGKTSKK